MPGKASIRNMENEALSRLSGVRAAFCLCASYCTLDKAVEQIRILRDLGCSILPVIC